MFFDQWTYGIDYIGDLASELKKRNVETFFLHLNSIVAISLSRDLRQKVSAKAEEAGRIMPTYDLRMFGNSPRRCFAQLKPSVIVTISMGHFADRVIKRTAHMMGIPVVFFAHGVKFRRTGTQAAVSMTVGWRQKTISQLIRHGVKYLVLTWLYFTGTRKLWETLVLLSRFVRRPKREILSPTRHPSINVDLALSSSNYEVDVFTDLYYIPVEKIVITGSPRLSLENTQMTNSHGGESFWLLYVDQRLPRPGHLQPAELRSLTEYLVTIAHRFDLKLAVKLHPRTTVTEARSWYSVADYIVGSDEKFSSALKFSKVVVGHFSTALLESLAWDRPLVILGWFDFSRRTELFSGTQYPWIVRKNEDFPEVLRQALDGRFDYRAVKHYYGLLETDAGGVVKAAKTILSFCDA